MDLSPVFLGLVLTGAVLVAVLGYGAGRAYFPLLIAARTHAPGAGGWVLVGVLAALAFIAGLVLLATPTLLIFLVVRMDSPGVKLNDLRFMSILGTHAVPMIWGVNRARRLYDDRLKALGLRFE